MEDMNVISWPADQKVKIDEKFMDVKPPLPLTCEAAGTYECQMALI